jgi:hypothetical protein
MNILRTQRVMTSYSAGAILALAVIMAGPAFADPYAFSFWQGPDEMILPADDFREFHSTLTNTGSLDDSYTMTITRQQSAGWEFCYDWDCEMSVYQVPSFGSLAPGQSLDMVFEVSSWGGEGEGTYSVQIVSNSEPSLQHTVQYSAWSPTEPFGLLLSSGETLIQTTAFSFVQFKPVLYNAGTEPDTYLLTMTRDLPPNWSATFCIHGICYPPTQTEQVIPAAGGQVFGGEAVPLEIDFTTFIDEGTGSVLLTITSLTHGTLQGQVSFTVTTEDLSSAGDVMPGLLTAVTAAPNPFNPRTEISFELNGQTPREVHVRIHDARGHEVRRLASEILQPGRHRIAWDGMNQAGDSVAAGVYVARIEAGPFRETVKLSLVK